MKEAYYLQQHHDHTPLTDQLGKINSGPFRQPICIETTLISYRPLKTLQNNLKSCRSDEGTYEPAVQETRIEHPSMLVAQPFSIQYISTLKNATQLVSITAFSEQTTQS